MEYLIQFVVPTSEDVSRFGPGGAWLYCSCRLANAFLFAFALAFLVSDLLIPSVDASPAFAHWRSGQRSLTVVDHTGDAAWQQATRWAVDRWNEAGTDLRLTWTTGRGRCAPDGTRVGVCPTSSQRLGSVGRLHFEGSADQDRDGDHVRGAVIRVCSDCGLSPSRRREVVTHELGHVLGLSHTRRPGSVMYPSGGAEVPDGGDHEALRDVTAHVDDP